MSSSSSSNLKISFFYIQEVWPKIRSWAPTGYDVINLLNSSWVSREPYQRMPGILREEGLATATYIIMSFDSKQKIDVGMVA